MADVKQMSPEQLSAARDAMSGVRQFQQQAAARADATMQQPRLDRELENLDPSQVKDWRDTAGAEAQRSQGRDERMEANQKQYERQSRADKGLDISAPGE